MTDKKRITVFDVANAAGVSPASVSRVLNNVQPISDELRHAVLDAASRLGYERRNAAAGSAPICIVVPNTENPYFHEITAGVQEQAAEYGLFVTEAVVSPRSDHARHVFRWLSRGNIEGAIFASSDRTIGDEMLLALRNEYQLPIVLVNRPSGIPGIPSIQIDLADGTYRATRHLLRLGHRRIAFLDGPEHSQSASMKVVGFDRALREAGVDADTRLRIQSEPTVDAGYQAMIRVFELPADGRPTAVLCLNDLNALGVLHAARARRVAVPEELSVIGFDDINMAAHANPPLTTISSPKHEMGRLAARLLHQIRTEGDASIQRYTMMESPLIVRESTSYFGGAQVPPKQSGNSL